MAGEARSHAANPVSGSDALHLGPNRLYDSHAAVAGGHEIVQPRPDGRHGWSDPLPRCLVPYLAHLLRALERLAHEALAGCSGQCLLRAGRDQRIGRAYEDDVATHRRRRHVGELDFPGPQALHELQHGRNLPMSRWLQSAGRHETRWQHGMRPLHHRVPGWLKSYLPRVDLPEALAYALIVVSPLTVYRVGVGVNLSLQRAILLLLGGTLFLQVV